MNELIINDRRVDLGENTNIGLTFCANNIGELQNRQGNFSNTFKLPITKTNKEIFEWSNLQTTASLMPYKKLKATYKQNGVEIVSDGVAEIQSTDNNYFYVNVYSGNLDLIEAIGDISVGELYKNDSTIRWNIDDLIVELFYKQKYYTFPFIDWRNDIDTFFNTTTIDVRQMLPCATIHSLFDRLAERIGFNFKGNFFSSQNYLNMILTPNSFSIPKSDAVKSSQPLISTLSTYTNIPSGSSTSWINYFPSFRNENNNPDFSTGVFKPSINKIGKLKFAGEYDLFFSGSLGGPTPIVQKTINVYVSISDVTGTIALYGPIIYGPNSYGLNKVFIDIETPEMTFIANTVYKVTLTLEVPQTNKNQIVNLTDYQTQTKFLGYIGGVDSQSPSVVFPHYLEFTPSPKIAYNTYIDFTKIFTMKVKDVLKDILNMEGIIIQTNNYSKSIQFNKFDDVILNKSIAKDWSDKLQNATQMGFKFGNYAKKNNVKFKTESEFDSYFNLTDENLEVEKDVIKFNHDATIENNKYAGYIIPKIDGLKDASNEWNNPSWRLLYLNQRITNFAVTYTDSVTNAIIGTNYNKPLPFCNFKNGKELIDENYSNIVSILTNPKVLKIVAKLDVTDISDLDFTIPIQIQRPDLNISGYFYINKIENYKGGLTSCEIIEI
jgi:hypothetical protein